MTTKVKARRNDDGSQQWESQEYRQNATNEIGTSSTKWGGRWADKDKELAAKLFGKADARQFLNNGAHDLEKESVARRAMKGKKNLFTGGR